MGRRSKEGCLITGACRRHRVGGMTRAVLPIANIIKPIAHIIKL
jgi:hypothetical protein